MKMYEDTDRAFASLAKRFIRMFGNAKGNLLPMDELNVLGYSKKLYAELKLLSEKNLLLIAQKAYENAVAAVEGESKSKINKSWLNSILRDYDPVMLYVWMHEVDRKEARFAESVIASKNREKVIDRAMRLWSNMAKQYSITVTDKATLQAYKDNGITKVKWLTVVDERRCSECKALDGKVFDIDKIPAKPHPYCRCWFVPVR